VPSDASDVLISSLAATLGTLRSLLSWGVVLAVGAGWAGLRNSRKVSIAGLSMERRPAFYAASFVYAAATVAVLLSLFRIEAIVLKIADTRFVEAYTTLAAHEWLLNPFGYLGISSPAQLSTACGIGLLILSWWICATSVVVLRGKEPLWKSIILLLPFYAAGLSSLWVVYRIYEVNLTRLLVLAPDIHAGIRATASARWNIAYASIPMGLALVAAALLVQRRH